MSNFMNVRLDNLVEIRKILCYNQEEIASYLSYDRSYYSKIENGLYELKIRDTIKLCLVLNCDITYIYNIKRKYTPLNEEDRISYEDFLDNPTPPSS